MRFYQQSTVGRCLELRLGLRPGLPCHWVIPCHSFSTTFVPDHHETQRITLRVFSCPRNLVYHTVRAAFSPLYMSLPSPPNMIRALGLAIEGLAQVREYNARPGITQGMQVVTWQTY
jgi:hypothetical protein